MEIIYDNYNHNARHCYEKYIQMLKCTLLRHTCRGYAEYQLVRQVDNGAAERNYCKFLRGNIATT